MQLGGWQDWPTFRDHYLAEFSPEAIRRERGLVEWYGGGSRDLDRDRDRGSSSRDSYAVVNHR